MSKYVALVPAYNEEKNIGEVVRRLKKINYDKIIVVDDGSKDKTAEIAKKLGAIVLRHTKNKGKGEALRTGINYILKRTEAEYAILIDADMQYNPEESEKFFDGLKKYDFVIGYRNWKKVPFRHRLGNFVWRSFFNLFFKTKFKDTNCGFIGMNRRTMEKIKKDIHGGYIIENSMLVSAIKNNLKIGQVPVNVRYNKISGIKRGLRVVLGVLIFIILEGLKYNFRINKR